MSESVLLSCDRGGNCCERSKQDERIIFRRQKAPPAPEIGGFRIDRMDHQHAPADQLRGCHRALERVLDQTGSDASPRPGPIRGELPEKQTWDRIGQLAGPDRPWQDGGHHGGRSEAIEADHPFRLVDDKNGGEAFRLIGKRARLEPVIEGRLAAIEIGKRVLLVEKFQFG